MQKQDTFGPYVLLEQVRRDPLGATWRAGEISDRRISRFCLLRLFDGEASDRAEITSAIARQAHLEKRLAAPGFGKLRGVGQDRGVPYVAYSYLPAFSFRELVEGLAAQGRGAGAHVALLMTERIALAVGAAWNTAEESERLPHGFLTSHHALVSHEGEVFTIGFGAAPGARQSIVSISERARQTGQDATGPVSVAGDFARYLSTAALTGEPICPSDDVYSLGVILFELLAGRPLEERPRQGRWAEAITNLDLSAETSEVAESIRALLRASLEDSSGFSSVSLWRNEVSRILDTSGHQPTAFNIAFLLRAVFADKIEQENRALARDASLIGTSVASTVESTGEESTNSETTTEEPHSDPFRAQETKLEAATFAAAPRQEAALETAPTTAPNVAPNLAPDTGKLSASSLLADLAPAVHRETATTADHRPDEATSAPTAQPSELDTASAPEIPPAQVPAPLVSESKFPESGFWGSELPRPESQEPETPESVPPAADNPTEEVPENLGPSFDTATDSMTGAVSMTGTVPPSSKLETSSQVVDLGRLAAELQTAAEGSPEEPTPFSSQPFSSKQGPAPEGTPLVFPLPIPQSAAAAIDPWFETAPDDAMLDTVPDTVADTVPDSASDSDTDTDTVPDVFPVAVPDTRPVAVPSATPSATPDATDVAAPEGTPDVPAEPVSPELAEAHGTEHSVPSHRPQRGLRYVAAALVVVGVAVGIAHFAQPAGPATPEPAEGRSIVDDAIVDDAVEGTSANAAALDPRPSPAIESEPSPAPPPPLDVTAIDPTPDPAVDFEQLIEARTKELELQLRQEYQSELARLRDEIAKAELPAVQTEPQAAPMEEPEPAPTAEYAPSELLNYPTSVSQSHAPK